MLDNYCHASGQAIHLGKSSMFFNEGADTKQMREVSGILGVGSIADPGLYLGLPTIWGRSKRDAMNFIKDRIKDKIKGCRNKLLNNVGKEVLITSISTYAMSIFQLSKIWCAEINGIIARFWWGEKDGERKIHWTRWERMTVSKHEGVVDSRSCKLSMQPC